MRIIMENGGIDLESILSSDNSISGKLNNDVLKEYLKNKETDPSEGA